VPSKNCPVCGRLFVRGKESPFSFFRRTYCSDDCSRNRPSALLSPKTRYRTTTKDGKHKGKHRAIMEQVIGRELSTLEYVHHKDGNPLNNAPDNLEVMTPKDHSVHHNQKYAVTKQCAVCGIWFVPHKTKRKRQQTCGSRECWSELMSRRIPGKTSLKDRISIRRRRLGGELLEAIAKDYGITISTVSAIAKGYRSYRRLGDGKR